MITPYRQTLPDTCLPSCLMMALSQIQAIQEPTFSLECKILIEGGKIGRLNRSFGHLLYVCKVFKVHGLYLTDNQLMLSEAEKLRGKDFGKLLEIRRETIETSTIERLLRNAPVVVGVDNYTFNHDFHFPHFVYVEGMKGQAFELNEPWQGKKLNVSKNDLQEAVRVLSENVGYWRELILLSRNQDCLAS